MDELRDSAVDLYATNNFEDERVTSNLAAALWLSDRYNYKESSLKNLSDFFFADSFSGTMGAPGYNEQLHDWLNNNTGNLLKNQVSGINFTEDTNAAITTTVYFKSSWQDEFSKGATRKDTFRAPDGNQTVDFMHKNERGRYYVSDNYTAAAVYMQEGYSMLFLLPDEGLTPNDLIKDASAMRFILSGDNAPENSICRINYSVPKFDVDSQLNLTGILASMGVTDVMDCHTSDFSNLTADTDEIFVKDIIHGARVKIDEEGCEAAAYTVIMMDNATAIREEPIVDFVLDRPFVFVIRNPEGKPLFVGTVYNIE